MCGASTHSCGSPCLRSAKLRLAMPLACIDLLCLCDASRCCAMPLLCLADLAFAKLCYSFALQLRSGRIRRSAKLSAAPHFLSHASQRPGGADLRDALAKPCYAIAFPSCSMPPQISSVLCLRISAPCHGRSVLCDSLAQLICAVLCPCSSSRIDSLPLLRRSHRFHASATLSYAMPLLCRATLCLRQAAPFTATP